MTPQVPCFSVCSPGPTLGPSGWPCRARAEPSPSASLPGSHLSLRGHRGFFVQPGVDEEVSGRIRLILLGRAKGVDQFWEMSIFSQRWAVVLEVLSCGMTVITEGAEDPSEGSYVLLLQAPSSRLGTHRRVLFFEFWVFPPSCIFPRLRAFPCYFHLFIFLLLPFIFSHYINSSRDCSIQIMFLGFFF